MSFLAVLMILAWQQPCDLNQDGACNVQDLTLMIQAILYPVEIGPAFRMAETGEACRWEPVTQRWTAAEGEQTQTDYPTFCGPEFEAPGLPVYPCATAPHHPTTPIEWACPLP